MCMHEVRSKHAAACAHACVCVCVQGRLTALFHGLIRPVFAVFHVVTHLAAVDTLAVLAAELSRTVALCDCRRHTDELRDPGAVILESNLHYSYI